jgi:hypothetical protein
MARKAPKKTPPPPVMPKPDGSEDEELLIRFVVHARLDGGRTISGIVRACAAPPAEGGLGLKVSFERVQRLLVLGMERLAGEHRQLKGFARDEQIERILQYVRRMMARDQPPMHQVMRAEELLADLLGNRAPIVVDQNVHVQGTLGVVVGQLTPERIEQIKQRARERMVAANEARRLTGTRVPPPQLAPRIEVVAPPARAAEGEPCVVEAELVEAPALAPTAAAPDPDDPQAAAQRAHQQHLARIQANRNQRRKP